LGISRGSFYYEPAKESPENLAAMLAIDKLFLTKPFYGKRRVKDYLNDKHSDIGHFGLTRVRRLMNVMGIEAIYPKKNLSQPAIDYSRYPYLLKDLDINHSNQVWATDITYIPMENGFMYLVAVVDWYSRFILSWELSNTLENYFCIEALHSALKFYGKPEIFNSDLGSQFTSNDFTKILLDSGIRISHDGKGRCFDNIMIERFWRTLKQELIYPCQFDTVQSLQRGLTSFIIDFNCERRHYGLPGNSRPCNLYFS
jgi:putative transposase